MLLSFFCHGAEGEWLDLEGWRDAYPCFLIRWWISRSAHSLYTSLATRIAALDRISPAFSEIRRVIRSEQREMKMSTSCHEARTCASCFLSLVNSSSEHIYERYLISLKQKFIPSRESRNPDRMIDCFLDYSDIISCIFHCLVEPVGPKNNEIWRTRDGKCQKCSV